MVVNSQRASLPRIALFNIFCLQKGEMQKCLCSQGLWSAGSFLFPNNGAEAVRGSRNLTKLQRIALVSQAELNSLRAFYSKYHQFRPLLSQCLWTGEPLTETQWISNLSLKVQNNVIYFYFFFCSAVYLLATGPVWGLMVLAHYVILRWT